MSNRILSAQQVKDFFELGYTRIDGLYGEAEMQQMEQACDSVYQQAESLIERDEVTRETLNPKHDGSRFTFEPDADGYALRHVAWCGQCEPIFDRFGRDEKLLSVVGDLLGCQQVNQLINQIHYKKPGTAVKFDWHQDCQHRGIASGKFTDVLGNGSYVQIAVAVDDVAADSGPLGFLPRSNQHGFLGALYNEAGEFGCAKVSLEDAHYPLLRRGDAVAFGSYTIHGSEANTGKRARRTFINGFAAPGADKKVPSLGGEGRLLDIPAALATA